MNKDQINVLGAGLMLSLACVVVNLIPDSRSRFAYSATYLLSLEAYRLIMFMFTHVTGQHLIENAAAILMSTILAMELEVSGAQLLGYFFGSSLIVALIESPMFPDILIAGASVGIASILGLLSLKGRRFISSAVLIPIFLTPIFMKFLIGGQNSLPELVFHLSGFIAGITIFFAMKRMTVRKRILQVDYSGTD